MEKGLPWMDKLLNWLFDVWCWCRVPLNHDDRGGGGMDIDADETDVNVDLAHRLFVLAHGSLKAPSIKGAPIIYQYDW